ncbi:SAVMC3_10250 family protein [Streptomyces sp. NPDC004126]|uniref:SAVMC3_10250 family protein n=1 Tax=Streptomyces sp. NPDC004126 TaxID=3390695 RepID=UPI003D069637
MRDLLYLSENKMRALIPQLPGGVRRRLQVEAGLNIGVASAKAALTGEPQRPSVALLDATVKMIEKTKGVRQRTERDLRAGDWIRFEDEFRFGDAVTTERSNDSTDHHPLAGLVYFATTQAEAPFVLIGSSVNVLDRWQSGQPAEARVGWFYMDAVLAYAHQLALLPDEAATSEFTPPDGLEGGLGYGLWVLCRTAEFGDDDRYDRWASEPIRLSGHARVLATLPTDGPPCLLATPLYVEYTARDDHSGRRRFLPRRGPAR